MTLNCLHATSIKQSNNIILTVVMPTFTFDIYFVSNPSLPLP